VYIAARDENSAKKTIEELKEETGNQDIFFLKLDLADLASVKAAAEEFTGKETKLHTLYNNASALSQSSQLGHDRLTSTLTARLYSHQWRF